MRIEHIWAVGYSSMLYPPARRKLAEDRLAGKIDQEIAGSYYQTENYDRIIDAMVKHGVAWTPTIAKWLRPLSPSAERFRQRENRNSRQSEGRSAAGRARGDRQCLRQAAEALYARATRIAKIGYEKANEFIRRFVKAGGLLKEGSDPPRGMAALLMHEALVMDVEAGVPPMMAIQSATLNVAKAFGKDKDYGSVEAGKVADLSIIEGDPLEDIWMTQNVKMVIMDGKSDRYRLQQIPKSDPSFYSYQSLPMELHISPPFVRAGSGANMLRVSGDGMWPFHRVLLNGSHCRPDMFRRVARGDRSSRDGCRSRHLFRHGEERRRTACRIAPGASDGRLPRRVMRLFQQQAQRIPSPAKSESASQVTGRSSMTTACAGLKILK